MSTRFQHHFSILFQFRPRSNAVDISLTIPALVNLIFCDSCDRTTTITIHVEIFTSEDSAVVSYLFYNYRQSLVRLQEFNLLTFIIRSIWVGFGC